MPDRTELARLGVARIAARLFAERGFSATSGSDIAAAAGISERTVWRYFRNKESCVAPLFAQTWQRFARELGCWPRGDSIEQHLADQFALDKHSPEEIADMMLVVRLIAALPEEPDLRSVWLHSYHDGEEEMAALIGERLGRSHHDFEVRLCAAAVMGAVRTVDETISRAAVRDGQAFTTAEVVAQMSRAIRAVSNLPFCDPVVPRPFGDSAPGAANTRARQRKTR
ncbi:TetR family transcriptional regulator [Acidovorax sp. sic0104]|uniref:TetR family transcriptional regulator n=1 Tax=Acidovorax sp. sic0104 TaxID=2854784 RepID=UPI001C45F42F|nr:TetR family transcriptional regulator [Acidovorax sp. sic0104]MBV7541147.1 TetR/AcrR family transcriptional regulator [Acidovorax sp. sic0104]